MYHRLKLQILLGVRNILVNFTHSYVLNTFPGGCRLHCEAVSLTSLFIVESDLKVYQGIFVASLDM